MQRYEQRLAFIPLIIAPAWFSVTAFKARPSGGSALFSVGSVLVSLECTGEGNTPPLSVGDLLYEKITLINLR